MAEYPALPLWTDAYLGDTTHLTTIEHGAYLLLLMAMWRNGGKLPNDDARLARYARLTAGQWARMRPTLIEFFRVEGDEITQGRLTDELDAVRRNSARQSDKAKARWLKTKEPQPAAAVPDECRTDASLPLTLPNKKKDPPTPRKRGGDDPEFDAFWAAYPLKVAKGAALKAWPKARAKAEAAAIIEGARRYVTDPRRKPDFTAHASTWLNAERWGDYAPQPQAAPVSADRTDASAKRLAEWVASGKTMGPLVASWNAESIIRAAIERHGADPSALRRAGCDVPQDAFSAADRPKLYAVS